MICRESQKGGVYWECNKCGYTRNKKQIYPREGRLVCEKCNAALKFDMRNNPGWVCEGEKPHFRQLQIRDLKLPRMREMIPKDKIEEVEKRFAISNGISQDIDCKIDTDERTVRFIPTTDGEVAQLVMNFDE